MPVGLWIRRTAEEAVSYTHLDVYKRQVHAVLNAGMNPIICVGESLEQRETGITDEWIALQVKSALYGVPADKRRRCIIA